MALDSFDSAVDGLLAEARASLQSVDSLEALEAFRIQFTGAKNGALKSLQKLLGAVPPEHKPAAGKRFNQAREAIEQLLTEATDKVSQASSGKPKSSTGPLVDPTLPGLRPRIGVLHPITQTLEHLKEIMGRLGFNVTEGPEIEDEWHNFVALNIPEDHPARDPLDNFYLATAKINLPKSSTDAQPAANSGGADIAARLLRSQTSTVQIRVMESTPLPLRIISLGRVYRPDAPDATHFPMFHQMEGLWVDKNVTMAQLKSVLRLFATSYLGGDVNVRFRPSFFPFTEPSVEVDSGGTVSGLNSAVREWSTRMSFEP